MITLSNVKQETGNPLPVSINKLIDTLPEVKNTLGVSVRFVYDETKQWFVLRATYGRAQKACDFLVNEGIYSYLPLKYVEYYKQGKRKKTLKPLIPNMFFVYTTLEKVEELVKRTPSLSFLNYYYNHFQTNRFHKNPPLTIPYSAMESFIIATGTNNKHLLFLDQSKASLKTGERVVVKDGLFKGIEGKICRIAGQQRVVISLEGIGALATAYIPTAFLQKI